MVARNTSCSRDSVPDSIRAKALLGFGSLSGDLLGRARASMSALRGAVDLYRTIANEPGTRLDYATALNSLGVELATIGEYDEAEVHYKEALEISRELGVQWGWHSCSATSGKVAANSGRVDDARERFDRGVDEARRLGSTRLLADALGARGTFERDFGEVDRAVERLRGVDPGLCRFELCVRSQVTRVALAIALVRLGEHDRGLELFGPNAEAILGRQKTLGKPKY